MTVRRDLELLDERGLLEKVHGGATALEGSAMFEPTFAAKSSLNQAEKDAIADAAAALVEPGMAIGVSAGTTTYALARRLADVAGTDRGHELDPGRRCAPPDRTEPIRRSS